MVIYLNKSSTNLAIYFKIMKTVPENFLKPYNPNEVEDTIYKEWLDSGYFNPDNLKSENILKDENGKEEVFSIVLPPPNVTGVLHLGHAYEDSLQDLIVRFKRMQGKRTLWIPGTDSAAIATQSRVEKNIQKEEGKNRYDLGREEMVKRVSEYAKSSENTIISQVKKMGASLDWSRYAYTLDEKRELAVMTAFKRMYDEELIYKGHRIVNWDPKGQTTMSDDEILYKEENTKFYYFKYGPFIIGTSRPETKFGDKYVVMHPKDERYKEYKHGQKIELEWINGPIEATIIKDDSIDMEFGTGVMTITPWHSVVDFDLAQKYNLDYEQIIDKYGKLLPIAGEFSGIKISEAREKIVEKLQTKGLVEKIEDYTHNIATSERTGGIIEPQIMEQWFIDVNKEFVIKESKIPGIKNGDKVSLKSLMKISVESGRVSIPQENFKKIYFHWINNLRDWCISRQIWFGHRIPVWYQKETKEVYCDLNPPTDIENWYQDEDVLDTWFSSALWTFSTLGWPEKTSDLEKFHPTSFMSPAYEILPLWVSRMILMSGFHLGEIPFKTVMIHGLVRDSKGQKFSKSLNNGVDPVEMIQKYGADALRIGLIIGTAYGNDLRFDEQKIKGYKHFSNKIWNATRFVLEKTADYEGKINIESLNENHKNIYNAWKEKLTDITSDLENYRFYLAGEKLYDYFWKTFADVIIEDCKKEIIDNTENKNSAQALLLLLLREQIISLHPFMPFVTEEIWKYIKNEDDDLLVVTKWQS